VLPHGRDGTHARLDALHCHRRQWRLDGTVRCVNLPPTVARLELLVLPELLHGVEARISDLRLFQTLHHLRGGKPGERADDDVGQFLTMGIALAVAAEAGVGGQL